MSIKVDLSDENLGFPAKQAPTEPAGWHDFQFAEGPGVDSMGFSANLKKSNPTEKKLMDFKSGAKPATIMHQLSKGYTDEQLAAIAGWFAAQKK